MSVDKNATKYCSTVQKNGYRVEIVQPQTMQYLFGKMVRYCRRTNGCAPSHVYYFRDGVSEGQFSHVLEIEIKEMKRMFHDEGMQWKVVNTRPTSRSGHIKDKRMPYVKMVG